MKYTLTITAWYLNTKRVCQLINSKQLIQHLSTLGNFTGPAFAFSSEGIAQSAIKQELEAWLHKNTIPSLGELIVKNQPIKNGTLFTIYQDFYGKGLSKYNNVNSIPRNAVAELHNKLKYSENTRLRILYSPKNLFCNTAWSRLGGHTRLFCFCYVERVENGEIIARPYVIGDLHTGLKLETPESWDVRHYGEIHVSQIDQFALIKKQFESEKSVPDINVLKSIPEETIKSSIADILHEGNLPKDWGGEKSDLFTCNISVDGRFMPSAFLLKGPAKFSKMKMSHLGKNGDQIVRLFSEPADLLVLQHCHSISTAVRSTMKAFASRFHDLRYFTVIDGYDTVRLLKAYDKCGL